MFLQFITGSDIISCDSIEVTFSALDGNSHRPVAHTCGPLLEIPSSYQSYNELSEEFSELLQNKEARHFNIVQRPCAVVKCLSVFNPLTSISDQNRIYLYNINTISIQCQPDK